MEPRRLREPQNKFNQVTGYKILHDKNDALVLIINGTTKKLINKDCDAISPTSRKKYEKRSYGWNMIIGYNKIEDKNKTIYRFKLSRTNLNITINGQGEIVSVRLPPIDHIYLPLECLVNLEYFGVYGVLIGIEFIVDREGRETLKLVNRLLKLNPNRVKELVDRQTNLQRERVNRGDGIDQNIQLRFETNDYEIVEVVGIPSNINSLHYYNAVSVQGKKTLEDAVNYVEKSIHQIMRSNTALSEYITRRINEPTVQPIQPIRPTQSNIVLNEGQGFNNMNTMLRGQTGTFTQAVGNNVQTVIVIEETQYVNGRQVGVPRRYTRYVNTVSGRQPIPPIQYNQYRTQRINPFQQFIIQPIQPVQPIRQPIMGNISTNREVINVDEETEDNSVYSHSIGPERRPIAQIRPAIKDDVEIINAVPMEEETEEENRSITEEEPQLTIQEPVQQNTRTMSDDSETEEDSETVEVNWN